MLKDEDLTKNNTPKNNVAGKNGRTNIKKVAMENAIFNNIHFSIIATDEEGVIQIFNDGAEHMLGFSAQEMIGKVAVADLFDPQDMSSRSKALSFEQDAPIPVGNEALFFKAGRGLEDSWEASYLRKDGSKFASVISISVLQNKEWGVLGYLLVGTDNSTRKETEAAQALLDQRLRDQQFYTRSLIESNIDALMTTDPQGIISDVNQQMIALTGRTRDELIGAPCRDFFTDPQMADAAIKRVLTENKVSNYELTVRAQNGEETVVSYNAATFRNRDRKLQGVFAAARDMTELKQVSQYARSLIEASLDPLVTISVTGKITDVNQATVGVTGVSREGLIGTDFFSYFTEAERAREAYQRVFAEGFVTDYPLTIHHKEGRLTDVLYNASVYKDTKGQVLGVVAAARDVTERKRFEKALQEKNIELERASVMKSEFLATMSHELRTPLNAIIGFSEALKDGLMGHLSEMQNDIIGDIFTSGQHLLSLINDILDLSKIEAGMGTLDLENVDLHSLLSNSLSIVREKASTENIDLSLEVAEDIKTMFLDMRKAKQIAYNLLSNAVKFTPPGGRVVLAAKIVDREAVGILDGMMADYGFPLDGSSDRIFVEITVKDSGIGISKENMAKLFQAFSQIDSRLARKFEGTGLGLATVRQLAELHGGTVALNSKEGLGSTFAVWLPVWSKNGQIGASEKNNKFAGRKCALVLEDDDVAADELRGFLEDAGLTVLRATDEQSAIRLALETPPDIIMLDVDLSDRQNWDFVTNIREKDQLAKIPLVIIDWQKGSQLSVREGAVAILQNPIAADQLAGAMKQLGFPPEEGRLHRVLVVDDDPKNVDLISDLLNGPSYDVIKAYGGGEGIALVQQQKPDLIILDLRMPGINGFTLIDEIGKDLKTRQTPVLIVTDRNSAPLRDELSIRSQQKDSETKKHELNKDKFMEVVKHILDMQGQGDDAHLDH